jgi:hypothetical protein
VLFISIVVLIVSGIGGRFISQLAYSMLITVAFLLLSDNLYQKLIGPFQVLHSKKQVGVSDV